MRTVELKRPFSFDDGHSFIAPITGVSSGDLVLLLENGRYIGTPHQLHARIRAKGGGLFSVWGDSFYFSSSDGSDCNANAREYALVIFEKDRFAQTFIEHVAKDDEATLKAFVGNSLRNNSIARNFFGDFSSVLDALRRSGTSNSLTTVAEVGCGEFPYAAIRFLMEGSKRFIANDILSVHDRFARSFVDVLVEMTGCVSPCLNTTIFEGDDPCRVRGLEARGGLRFEKLNLDREVDLIISFNALEHVMSPEEVAVSMAGALAPGGMMFHTIDFCDHRDYADPFKFYALTAEEYAPIATENRLRPSDWMKLLKGVGFDIIERRDRGSVYDRRFCPAGVSVLPTISAAGRELFAEPFRSKDLADLSVTCSQILCRKRG